MRSRTGDVGRFFRERGQPRAQRRRGRLDLEVRAKRGFERRVVGVRGEPFVERGGDWHSSRVETTGFGDIRGESRIDAEEAAEWPLGIGTVVIAHVLIRELAHSLPRPAMEDPAVGGANRCGEIDERAAFALHRTAPEEQLVVERGETREMLDRRDAKAPALRHLVLDEDARDALHLDAHANAGARQQRRQRVDEGADGLHPTAAFRGAPIGRTRWFRRRCARGGATRAQRSRAARRRCRRGRAPGARARPGRRGAPSRRAGCRRRRGR